MDEAVRKARLCYQQFKEKNEQGKSWVNKNKFKGRKHKPAYLKNFGRDHQRKNFNKPRESQTAQSQVASKPTEGDSKKEGTSRIKEPLKCWGCGGPHILRDCPHRNIHMLMGDREATRRTSSNHGGNRG